MKILLDENLPKKLKRDFSEHEIYTVTDRNWNGKKNGELLALMTAEDFQALFTFDPNLEHQQNFAKYPIAVFVFIAKNNIYQILSELVPNIKTELEKPLQTGITKIQK